MMKFHFKIREHLKFRDVTSFQTPPNQVNAQKL